MYNAMSGLKNEQNIFSTLTFWTRYPDISGWHHYAAIP